MKGYEGVRVSGGKFDVVINDPCTPKRLQQLRFWPLLCPKPEPSNFIYEEMPEWMLNVPDQVTYVGESTEHIFEDTTSIYGDPMVLTFDYGLASGFL